MITEKITKHFFRTQSLFIKKKIHFIIIIEILKFILVKLHNKRFFCTPENLEKGRLGFFELKPSGIINGIVSVPM